MGNEKLNTDAVKIEGRQARLEISYKIIDASGKDIESESNSFSEVIGGREDYSPMRAVQLVVEYAKAWAQGMRDANPGWEISAWDELGNYY